MNRLLCQAVLLLLWIRGGLSSHTTTANTHDHFTTSHFSTITPIATIPITFDPNDFSLAASTTASISTESVTAASNATCSSRTANYITHTLAQQCLRTDRVPPKSAHTTSPDSSELSTILPEPSTVVDRTTEAVSQTEAAIIETTSNDSRDSSIAAAVDVQESSSTSLDATTSTAADEDADSPLDNANFLSFEEWKNQNLAKAGQSPEDLQRAQQVNPNRLRPGINNALDTLGEDHEIDLDFSGFGGGAQAMPAAEVQQSRSSLPSDSASPVVQDLATSPTLRSKDAGKTCKERTNYASFDCAATILKSNKECKSASSVLVENKDSYMLNICSAENKFFIVELCDDIQIDTVVLANYEFFSSSFRHFKISVSDRYPVKLEKWRDLGTFEARNTREIQAFLVQNPLIWARYMRIEFLTHYGTEYYCPVSVVRVHGTTMWEDYRHQEELARGEEEEVPLEVEAVAAPPVAQEPLASSTEDLKSTIESIPEVKPSESLAVVQEAHSSSATMTVTSHGKASVEEANTIALTAALVSTESQADAANATQRSGSSESPNPGSIPSVATDEIEETSWSCNATEYYDCCCEPPNVFEPDYSEPSDAPCQDTSAEARSKVSAADGLNITRSADDSQAIAASRTDTLVHLPTHPIVQNSSSSEATRPASSTVASQPPQPSSQESFFKSFHKRLQQLEANSTLSLQYIEEQSRILRDAFTKVEKRQLATTTKFLSQLNDTVMTELHGFRLAYDQLWQSTVLELEGQREAYEDDMVALSSRLTMVADELVWQKRMGIVQSTLLLLCLVVVMFGRAGSGQLEVPLMQQMMNKSAAAFRASGTSWDSPPNSPSPDSRSPVSLFRRKIWRSSPDSDGMTLVDSDVNKQPVSLPPSQRSRPEIIVEAPSPDSRSGMDEYFEEGDGLSSPEGTRAQQGALGMSSLSPKKQRKKQKRAMQAMQAAESSAKRAGSPLASS